VGGTASAQILLVLAAPLLTRLYTPEDFGLLAVYASLLALIGVISSLRYELAIPLPEDDGEAANVAALCLILVGVMTLLTGILVLLLDQPIADALGVPQLAPYLWLLPVGVLISGAYTVFNYWAIRTKRFSSIAGTKLRQAIATIAIQLAAFKLGGIALLFGQVAGQGVGTATLSQSALANAGFKQVSWGGIWRAAGRYRRFPTFSAPGGLIGSSSTQVLVLGLAYVFGQHILGLFSLTHRVISVPLTLIGSAVGQIFLAEGPAAYRTNHLDDLVRKIYIRLSFFFFFLFFLLASVAPVFFSIVFGEIWRVSGLISSLLFLLLYFQSVSSPLSTIFTITENQHLALIFHGVRLLLASAAIFLAYLVKDINSSIIFISLGQALGYISLIYWVAKISGVKITELMVVFFKSLAVGFFVALPVILIKPLFDIEGSNSSVVGFIVSLLLIMLHYYFLAKKEF